MNTQGMKLEPQQRRYLQRFAGPHAWERGLYKGVGDPCACGWPKDDWRHQASAAQSVVVQDVEEVVE